jgi:hypothetical protein
MGWALGWVRVAGEGDWRSNIDRIGPEFRLPARRSAAPAVMVYRKRYPKFNTSDAFSLDIIRLPAVPDSGGRRRQRADGEMTKPARL